MKNIYFDNNATTKVAPEVVDAMTPFFKDYWGNPSSMHTFGGQVKEHVDTARGQVASLIGADPSEIIFTSCGTESDNMAIRGLAETVDTPPHIVTSKVEHPAVLAMAQHLTRKKGTLVELKVDSQGHLNLDELRDSITDDTTIVSLMWANNETGVIFPIDEIAEIVKAAGCIFHTDAVQAVGKIPIDVSKTPVDMLSLSGHKIHAPKGVGALYVRKGTKLNPLLWGGHQERGKRAGTENVPYIVGIGKACELAAAHIDEYDTKVRAMRDRLEAGILETCPDAVINGDCENRLSNTFSVGFKHVEGEAILLMLDDLGIAASSGSACTSGSLEPSHVLRALGVPFTYIHGSTRFSLSRYTTDADIDYALEKIPGVIERLREISPFSGEDAPTSPLSCKNCSSKSCR
ncbi:MAG: cysteine desulfurase NifS [Phycisphaerae bacterium]|nr:cysteine desulfurase NifS [Phycisphaerae bacterium]